MSSEVDYTTEKVSAILDRYGIDLNSKGGRALLCCATVACFDSKRSIGTLCAEYAAYRQTNVWAVHRSMANACKRAKTGHSPGKLLRQVVGEVCQSADGVSVAERG